MSEVIEAAEKVGDRENRRIIAVLISVVILGAASFTSWAVLNAKGEAFVDRRIEIKLKEQEVRYLTDMAVIKGDIAVIRQILEDRKADK